ncbi:MAG: endonuclease VII domain-containing protein [Nitrososphaera sp.]|nr:endonuclease VII domain-containing protein [Nitrososphaera sp.]
MISTACRKEYDKERYERNKEQAKERSREWKKNNKAHTSEYNKKYYAANAEREKERSRAWGKNNQERKKEYNKKWNKTNEEQRRDTRLLSMYKLPRGQYQEMFVLQNGRCAICNTACLEPHGYLDVDHNHITKKIRELLCQACNKGIGLLKDDPGLCDKAATYLRKHQ